MLGGKGLVAQAAWPMADGALVRQDTVTMAVQVNGKRRAEIELPRDADQASVEAAILALEAINRALKGATIKKIIVVPNRIANIVVA